MAHRPVAVLLISVLSGCIPGSMGRSASVPARATQDVGGGFPAEALSRPDLRQLIEAGLDRRSGLLITALAARDPATRLTAAHALASVPDTAALPALSASLGDTDAAVRAAAAFAIGQLGPGPGSVALLSALQAEADADVRVWMMEAVGKTGDRATLRSLAEWVRTGTGPSARHGAALAFYHAGRRGAADSSAAGILLGLVADADTAVATTAALALAAPRDAGSWGVDTDAVLVALSRLHPHSRAAGPLLAIAGRRGTDADIDVLVRWLGADRHWTTRVAAANALPARGALRRDAESALIAALDDPSPHVAVAAAAALVRHAPAPVTHADAARIAELSRARRHRPPVAAALLPALAGTAHEAWILEWSRGETEMPRSLAWGALAEVAGPAADSLLLDGLQGARREAYVAAAALAQRMSANPTRADLQLAAVAPVTRSLHAWGAYAPASDVRGVLRLVELLLTAQPVHTRELRERAAEHPHADLRAAAERAGAVVRAAPAQRQDVDWALLEAAGARPRIEIRTPGGNFIVELYPRMAPLAASALLRAVATQSYDGLTFHRVEPAFILQSGDFDNPHGSGGPLHGLRSEIGQLRYAPGVLGMASAGRDTEGSQYFITHNHAPSLDGRYGAVGRVISGLEIADRIALGDAVVTIEPVGWDARTVQQAR